VAGRDKKMTTTASPCIAMGSFTERIFFCKEMPLGYLHCLAYVPCTQLMVFTKVPFGCQNSCLPCFLLSTQCTNCCKVPSS